MIEITRGRLATGVLMVGAAAFLTGTSQARSEPAPWSPQKNIEFIVPTAAGSTMDVLARLIQDLWQRNRLITTTMTIQSRPGGGGAIAWSYVSQKAGDGHYLAISGPTLLANDVLGIGDLKYKDVTPLAQLFTEYEGFAVNAKSPIKTGSNLVKALTTPAPPSVGIAPGFGGSSHVALLRLTRAAGIDPNTLTMVPFKGANESVTAVLGGHVDVAIGTMSVLAPHLASGQLRAIAVAAPARLAGVHSTIPTWKEQGLDVVEGNWRGVVGPKNLGEAQVQFWSSRLAAVVKADEWSDSLARNNWDADFRTGAEAQRFLDAEYDSLRSTLAAFRVGK